MHERTRKGITNWIVEIRYDFPGKKSKFRRVTLDAKNKSLAGSKALSKYGTKVAMREYSEQKGKASIYSVRPNPDYY